MEPKGKRQVPSPPGGSPTAVSPEGLFPVLGDEALDEILGPSIFFMEESAGGTLHCASCPWQPPERPWACRGLEAGEVLSTLTTHPPQGG